MKKEEELLLSVCKCAVNGGAPEISNDIDWTAFISLARHHNLLGVCHCVLNGIDTVPNDIRKRLLDCFFDIVFIYESQSNALDDIKNELEKSNVRHVFFKGAVLRSLYTVPESRTMGDIDLLVDMKDFESADAAFKKIGFEQYFSNGTVINYKRDNVVVELHTSLVDNEVKNGFEDAFENAVFDGVHGEFDDSFHLAYMIAHTANHLKYTGAGIRFVLDIAFLLKHKSIDFNVVFDILDKIGLSHFARVLLSVCMQWFGYGEIYTANTERVCQYLIEDGVFGSMKDDVSYTVSRLRQVGAFDNGDKKQGKFALAIKLAFPSYSSLRKASYIKFLDGRPWLLPMAWCYRFAYNIKKTPSHMMSTVKNIDDERTITLAKEELEFFKEIGL